MTNLERLIDEIETASIAATPGPWEVDLNRNDPDGDPFIFDRAGIYLDDNAAFIAIARNTIPKLLEIIRVQNVALHAIGNDHDVSESTAVAREALSKVEELAGK